MLNDNRINLSRVRIEHAKEDLHTASENAEAGRYRSANNRAYYAMYHTIRALFALDGVEFKKHSESLGYFNKTYVHTGLIESRLNKALRSASKCRTDSDYEDFYVATKDEAGDNIKGAAELLEAVEQLIEARLGTEAVQEDTN